MQHYEPFWPAYMTKGRFDKAKNLKFVVTAEPRLAAHILDDDVADLLTFLSRVDDERGSAAEPEPSVLDVFAVGSPLVNRALDYCPALDISFGEYLRPLSLLILISFLMTGTAIAWLSLKPFP